MHIASPPTEEVKTNVPMGDVQQEMLQTTYL